MSSKVCEELTCNRLVSRPGGVKDSRPLNIAETEINAGSMGQLDLKEFSL